MAPCNSKESNASLLERLSCNIFITNFPTTFSATDLWSTCSKYGTVLDVYIPNKVSKQGKRFAFACFNKVSNVGLLIKNLRSVWLGNFHMFANMARFNRDTVSQKPFSNAPSKSSIPSYAKVVKKTKIPNINVDPVMVLEEAETNLEGNLILVGSVKDFKTLSNLHNVINSEESFKVNMRGKVYVVRAKEVTCWVPEFREDTSNQSDFSDDNYVANNNWVKSKDNTQINDDDVEVVLDSFQNQDFIESSVERNLNAPSKWVETKNHSVEKPQKAQKTNDSTPKFPSGLTPQHTEQSGNKLVVDLHEGTPHVTKNQNSHSKVEETKMVSFNVFVVKSFWGNMLFDFATSSARGTWLANNTNLLFILVSSPQELSLKRVLWTYMAGIINCWHGEVIIMGDFNEVPYPSEHYVSSFHSLNAAEFNRFIANSHLIDIPLGGYSFTWFDKYATPESDRAPFEGIFPKCLAYEQSCELEEAVDVINAVKEFFNSSSFLKGCNSSFISLIPKVLGANKLNEFRPISLTGCQFKIIGKILANRLSLVIGDIVSQEQSAFIKGRQIMDGQLILNELISCCKAKKEQCLLLKVDFQKAFDSVRWDHLDEILGKFGFGNKWRGWIRECLNSSKASVWCSNFKVSMDAWLIDQLNAL
nr:cysteine-rich receptor-like protein kinase [Tanacetum cinerariifolium]